MNSLKVLFISPKNILLSHILFSFSLSILYSPADQKKGKSNLLFVSGKPSP